MVKILLWLLACCAVLPVEGRQRVSIDESELQGKCGTELFETLRKWHSMAYTTGAELIYPENMVLEVEIPAGVRDAIPLSPYTDFNGCRMIVTNRAVRYFALFSLSDRKKEKPVEIGCDMINSGDYSSMPQLNSGLKLLWIKDRNPWTRRAPEEGDYDIFREDVVLIRDGKALNRTIVGYDRKTSDPQCRYVETDDGQKVICNLTFERSDDSTEHTRLIHIYLQNNVLVRNVKVLTPYVAQDTDDRRYREDYCIRVMNSANVSFEDVEVRGTYSSAKTWGYAVNLENVYNCRFLRFDAEAHWGVFGNNNVNTATLTDCHVNRFDLHCYGRDFTCRGCVFNNQIDDLEPGQDYCQTNVLNAFASMFGTLRFEDCRFVKSRPVYLRAYYKAYTGFDVVFGDCVFDLHPSFPYFVTAGLLDEADGPRRELRGKCWPNITMRDCQVNVPDGVRELYLFYALRNSRTISEIGHLSTIEMDGVVMNSSQPIRLKGSNVNARLKKRLKKQVWGNGFRIDTSMLR